MATKPEARRYGETCGNGAGVWGPQSPSPHPAQPGLCLSRGCRPGEQCRGRCSLPRSAPSVRLKMTGSGVREELGQRKLGKKKGRRSSWAPRNSRPPQPDGTARGLRPPTLQVSEFEMLPSEAGSYCCPFPPRRLPRRRQKAMQSPHVCIRNAKLAEEWAWGSVCNQHSSKPTNDAVFYQLVRDKSPLS